VKQPNKKAGVRAVVLTPFWCQSISEAGETDEERGSLYDFNKYLKDQTKTLE
jgi:hypothetical protein